MNVATYEIWRAEGHLPKQTGPVQFVGAMGLWGYGAMHEKRSEDSLG